MTRSAGPIVKITPKDVEGGKYSKKKVLITFNGNIKEPQEFEDQAKNKVTEIAPTLGYDYISFCKVLKNKIAVIVWSCENGTDYGFDILYLVKKNENNKITVEKIFTGPSNEYVCVDYAGIVNNKLIVKYPFSKFDKIY